MGHTQLAFDKYNFRQVTRIPMVLLARPSLFTCNCTKSFILSLDDTIENLQVVNDSFGINKGKKPKKLCTYTSKSFKRLLSGSHNNVKLGH